MSLNQKYTWGDFLKAHPEYKQKKIKRTSKEGQKAFEAAYKQHAKEYLKGRLAKIDDCLKKKKDATSAATARLERARERTKMLQKNI